MQEKRSRGSIFYFEGKGVEENSSLALKWAGLAAEKGYEDAKIILEKLGKK